MKKIGYFLLAAFLLIVLVGGLSCQSKTAEYTTATPEGTIRLFFVAFEELNANQVANLFVKEHKEKIYSLLSSRFSQFKSLSFSEVVIKKVIFQNDNLAEVKAEGDVTSYYVEHKIQRDLPPKLTYSDQIWKFSLEKRNGEWLIKVPPYSLVGTISP